MNNLGVKHSMTERFSPQKFPHGKIYVTHFDHNDLNISLFHLRIPLYLLKTPPSHEEKKVKTVQGLEQATT